jgi:hypothetical protein
LAKIPNIATEPMPDVEIIDFNERGAVLAVRPYTHTNHYWQVYFDTNRVIADTFGAAGYPGAGISPSCESGIAGLPQSVWCRKATVRRNAMAATRETDLVTVAAIRRAKDKSYQYLFNERQRIFMRH